MVDDLPASSIGEGYILQLNVEAAGSEGLVRPVQGGDVGHRLQPVQLGGDLLVQEGAVPHDLHLGVEDKGRHQEQKAVGQGDGPLQVEEGGQEHEGAAGELEHQNIEPQGGQGCLLLIQRRLLPPVEGLVHRAVLPHRLGEGAQHRDAPDVLQRLGDQLLLRLLHLGGVLCRGFLHHSQHIEAHQQAYQGQQGEPGAEKQHHYNDDDRHGHAAGDVRDKQHGILLQLHHRGGKGGLDGAQALVGEVTHGGAFHLLADSQPVVPEDVEALGAHRDVLQPLEQETAEHAGKGTGQ